MVRYRTEHSYLNDNLEVFGDRMDEFLSMLEADGRSKANMANIKAAMRSFLARCPCVGLGSMDAQVFGSVRAGMEADGLNPIYVRQAMLYMGRFVGFETGTNPNLDSDLGAGFDWCDGHLGRFLFQPELEEHTAWLRDSGYSERSVVRVRTHVTLALRILEREMGVASLDDVTAECFRLVEGMAASKGVAYVANLRFNLERFLRCFTSRSPLDMSKGPMPASYESTPEWTAFRDMLASYVADMEERGLRPRTVRTNARCAEMGYRAVIENVGLIPLGSVDYHAVRRVRLSMSNLRQRTARHYLSEFGRFIEFSFGFNPYRQAALLWSKEEANRTWITKSSWSLIWAEADVTQRAILALAGGMGMRRAEIAGLLV